MIASERNTKLSDVFFQVEERPIFIGAAGKKQQDQKQKQQDQKQQDQMKRIPQFSAIVDVEKNHVFSVVSEGYRLITNKEAVELGENCFCTVFSQTTAEGMKVFNIIIPKTRSFCHIDFIHEKGGFEPWSGDRWVPFLRVTNSYNRTKPLRFDLGFCRWICTNGVIFGEKSITFKYLHTRGEIAKTAQFQTNFGELKNLEKQFIEKMHNLKRYYVPKEVMLPLLCRVFDVRVKDEDLERPKRREQLFNFRDSVNTLTERYFNEIGPNGYAALNVITDFANRSCLSISPAAQIDQLQKRSGQWIDDFIFHIKHEKFNFDFYLGNYADCARILNAGN